MVGLATNVDYERGMKIIINKYQVRIIAKLKASQPLSAKIVFEKLMV
jgi:hypothetical protein